MKLSYNFRLVLCFVLAMCLFVLGNIPYFMYNIKSDYLVFFEGYLLIGCLAICIVGFGISNVIERLCVIIDKQKDIINELHYFSLHSDK